MSLQPAPAEPVQKACQVLLAAVSDEGCRIPGNLLEGVMSGKSLLQAILNGNLVVCQKPEPDKKAKEPVKPAAKKKAKKKKAKKPAPAVAA